MRGGHPWHRRCILGRHGGVFVASACGYEVAALIPGSPLPPITHICRRWPVLAWALWLAFGHHLLVEAATD